MVVSRRLLRELHGSGGYTSLSRLLAGFGLLVAVGLAAYVGGSSWYLGRILPGTAVGSQSLSGLTLPQARTMLVKMAKEAATDLTISGQTYHFTPADLGVTYDPEATLAAAYTEPRAVWWQYSEAKQPVDYVHSVATDRLRAAIDTVATKIGTQPVDATVVVKGGELQPVADQDGFTVDRVALARLVTERLGEAAPARLVAEPHRQAADIRLASLDTTITAAKQLMASTITLTYGERVWTPTQAAIGSWLSFVKTDNEGAPRLVPQIDRARLKSYAQTLAKQADVAPVNELVTVTNGARNVNQVGVPGVGINQDEIVTAIAEAVTHEQPLNFAVTDHAVPFKSVVTNFTVLDYPKYIEINLSKQHGWVWQDGQIVYDMPITSGATGAGFPTVTGKFAIQAKVRNTHLRGYQYGPRYNYDVAVDYWMPFYSGFGLHDASWRNGRFGGMDYYYGGSHGCVNLPDAAAAFVFDFVEIGTPVWVHG